jgi:hypothetical protein
VPCHLSHGCPGYQKVSSAPPPHVGADQSGQEPGAGAGEVACIHIFLSI